MTSPLSHKEPFRNGSAMYSDIDSATVEKLIKAPVSGALQSGWTSFTSGMAAKFTKFIGDIASTFLSVFGSDDSDVPVGFQALYEGLQPLKANVDKAVNAVDTANEKLKQAHRETLEAISQAETVIRGVKLVSSRRNEILQTLRHIGETPETSNVDLIKVIQLLAMANAESLAVTEQVNDEQQGVLKKLADHNREQLRLNDRQAELNQQQSALSAALLRTKPRFYGIANPNQDTGTWNIDSYCSFTIGRDYANVKAKEGWTGRIIGLHRATNGAVDFSITDITSGVRETRVAVGKGSWHVKLWLDFDYHLLLILPD